METPRTKAGEVTEAVMLRVKEKLGTISTGNYNGIFSAVLEEMNVQFPQNEIKRGVLFPGFYDRDRIDHDP